MDSEATTEFPKVDFSGLELSKRGTQAWNAARAQVRQALDSVGFFEAVFDKVTPELRDEIFGPMVNAMFSAPQDAKLRTASGVPYQGYIARTPFFNFEGMNINDSTRLESVQAFADLMWPQGLPGFCDTVWSFTKQLSELELMIRLMVVESLGVGNCYDSLVESSAQTFRIGEYGAPVDQETMITMIAHKDPNLVTILCQHNRTGLELLTKGGEWLRAAPNTFTVIIGESFEAWTNGRLRSAVHHVRMENNERRHSISFGSQFKDGYVIDAPEELVNDDYPKLFKPFQYSDYVAFRFSDQGMKIANNALKVLCGVDGDEVAA